LEIFSIHVKQVSAFCTKVHCFMISIEVWTQSPYIISLCIS